MEAPTAARQVRQAASVRFIQVALGDPPAQNHHLRETSRNWFLSHTVPPKIVSKFTRSDKSRAGVAWCDLPICSKRKGSLCSLSLSETRPNAIFTIIASLSILCAPSQTPNGLLGAHFWDRNGPFGNWPNSENGLPKMGLFLSLGRLFWSNNMESRKYETYIKHQMNRPKMHVL